MRCAQRQRYRNEVCSGDRFVIQQFDPVRDDGNRACDVSHLDRHVGGKASCRRGPLSCSLKRVVKGRTSALQAEGVTTSCERMAPPNTLCVLVSSSELTLYIYVGVKSLGSISFVLCNTCIVSGMQLFPFLDGETGNRDYGLLKKRQLVKGRSETGLGIWRGSHRLAR